MKIWYTIRTVFEQVRLIIYEPLPKLDKCEEKSLTIFFGFENLSFNNLMTT